MRDKTQFSSMPKMIIIVSLIVMIGALLGLWAYFVNYNAASLTLHQVKPQIKNQVVLTTNKTEYGKDEKIKLNLKNNLKEPVQFYNVAAERYSGNGKWEDIRFDIECPCLAASCKKAPPVIFSENGIELAWDQKKNDCGQAENGTYRFKVDWGVYNNGEIGEPYVIHIEPPISYSNEFTIGEVKEGVSITTDKAEYEKGEEIKINIKNNLNKGITFGVISLEADSGQTMEIFSAEDSSDVIYVNKFEQIIKDIYCPCSAKCKKLDLSVKANSSEKYSWNQKTGLCSELPIGKNLRFKISLWDDLESGKANLYYSNEFKIVEAKTTCDKLKEEINKLLEDIKYCESDRDCFIDNSIDLICPFGCYLLRSDIYSQDKPLLSVIKNKISEYGIECPSCLYECPYLPEQKDIKCQNNKCADIRFAKPNEKTPSLLQDGKNLTVDDWDWDPGQNCHELASPEQCDDFNWPISYGCRTANKYVCYSCLAERDKDSTICENLESVAFENETVKNFSEGQCYWRAVLGLSKAGMNDKIDFCDKFTNEITKEECLKLANKSNFNTIKQMTDDDKSRTSVFYPLSGLIKLFLISLITLTILILLVFSVITKRKYLKGKYIEERGGMWIGWVHGTFPFAKLTASSKKLTVRTFFAGNYSFSPEQVVSIRKQKAFPLYIFDGVQIQHTVSDYPQSINFLSLDNDRLIRDISAIGFVPKANPADIPKISSSAFRWQTILGGVIIWNILLMMDMSANKMKPGLFSFIALLVVFIMSVSMPKSRFLQFVFLESGRDHGEVRQYFLFSSFLSGIILLFFLIGLMLKNLNQ